MVGAGGAQLDGELHPGPGTELVGVHPQAEPAACAGGQDRAGLVAVERAAFAEDVDPAGVRRGGGQHRPADQADVVVGAAGVLGRDDVRAEERGLRRSTRGRSAGERASSATLRPYPLLISIVVVPCRSASRDQPARRGAQLVVARPRGSRRPWSGCRRRCTARRPSGRRTRRPGRRRRPGARGCPRSPGSTAPPPASIRSSAAGASAAGPIQAIRSSVDHDRRVGQRCRAARRSSSLVTSSPMLVMSRLMAVTAGIAARSSAAARRSWCAGRSVDDRPAVHDHVR